MDVGVNRLALGATLVLASAACLISSACEVVGFQGPLASKGPPRGPELACVQACEARVPLCTPKGCERGCSLVLDRLAEHEGDNVLACVAGTQKVCDDRAWSHCAARIGVHADGGPPPPPPPKDFEDEDTE
jgi:hypothetical protein